MKIFIGTANITDAPRILKKGFLELGHSVDTAVIGEHSFYETDSSVLNVAKLQQSVSLYASTTGALHAKTHSGFLHFAKRYDMFIFIASSSLFPRLTDLHFLHDMGKIVVCYQTGSELRHGLTSVPFWSAYGHQFPEENFVTQIAPFNDAESMAQKNLRAVQELCSSSSFTHTLFNKMYNTRMAEQYATTICTHPSIISLGIRPHMRIQLPFDSQLCTFSPRQNTVPLVVHAPSKRAFKRTDIIVNALQELADEGIPFHLRVLENVTNAEVLDILTQADILVDQIVCGGLGRLALEGMASGCAVLSGNSASVPWPPDRPALSISPLNIKERLRRVLTDKHLRLELAAQGYEFIQKGYHSPTGSAQSILDAVESEKEKKFDYYPTIFSEIATRTHNEPIPFFLQNMTLDILKKHGTSPTTDLSRLEREGFLPPQSSNVDIPRWDMSKLHKTGPWNWCGKHIPVPNFDREHVFVQEI